MTRPLPAPATWPYRDHRTCAEVDAINLAIDTDFRVAAGRNLADWQRQALTPADRTPCPWCGVRADVGCSHRIAA